ncbi:MAG: hypothetical protein FWF84_02930, partial [Kiritimatiellaeota bacterium]|nr:hypothetical protein [Kiritimatiellota bacterium]
MIKRTRWLCWGLVAVVAAGWAGTLTALDPKLEMELLYVDELMDMRLMDYAELALADVERNFKSAEAQAAVKVKRQKQDLSQGRFEKVAAAIREEKDQDAPATWAMKLSMADYHFAFANYKEALAIYKAFFEKYKEDPPEEIETFFRESLYKYAQMLLLLKMDTEALVAYERLIELKGITTLMRRQMMFEAGEILLRLAKQSAAGSAERKQYLEQAEKNAKGVMWEMDLWYGRGIALLAHIRFLGDNIEASVKAAAAAETAAKAAETAAKAAAKTVETAKAARGARATDIAKAEKSALTAAAAAAKALSGAAEAAKTAQETKESKDAAKAAKAADRTVAAAEAVAASVTEVATNVAAVVEAVEAAITRPTRTNDAAEEAGKPSEVAEAVTTGRAALAAAKAVEAAAKAAKTSEAAQKLLDEYMPQLREIEKSLIEAGKRDEQDYTHLSPVAECRYLLGVIYMDAATKKLSAENLSEAEKDAVRDLLFGTGDRTKGGALRHFISVYTGYPGSTYAPDSVSRTEEIMALSTEHALAKGIDIKISAEKQAEISRLPFQSAQVVFNPGLYEKATEAYLIVLRLYPEVVPSAVVAVENLVRAYNEMWNPMDETTAMNELYADMATAYLAERFCENDEAMPEAGSALLRLATFYGERGQEGKKLAINEAYFRLYPDHTMGPAILFSSAEQAFRAQDWGLALAGYKRLVAEFPKSPSRLDAMSQMAHIHRILAQSAEEAAMLEQYVEGLKARTRTQDGLPVQDHRLVSG